MSEFPESLGECVDRYREKRDLRLAMQKEVDAVADEEKAFKAHILQQITEQAGTTGVAGERYRAQRTEKRVPKVVSWPDVHAWIAKHNRFDLLQKRLSDKAVIDMWESDQEVPGIESAVAVDLSVTKI